MNGTCDVGGETENNRLLRGESLNGIRNAEKFVLDLRGITILLVGAEFFNLNS